MQHWQLRWSHRDHRMSIYIHTVANIYIPGLVYDRGSFALPASASVCAHIMYEETVLACSLF